jgi:hypothetical protein
MARPLFLTAALLFLLVPVATTGKDVTGRLVADFESADACKKLKKTNGTIQRVADGEDGHFLRFTVPAQKGKAWITIPDVPSDIRPYRRLRARLRADRTIPDVVTLRLRSAEGALREEITGLTVAWRDLDIALPDMGTLGTLDPTAVYGFRIVIDDPSGFVLDIDDVFLVEEPGGYRWSEAEKAVRDREKEERWWKEAGQFDMVEVFGKKRARKVSALETDHFAIFSDTKAARSKFARSMESIHDAVCKHLGIDGMPGRLPVFVFQNKKLYREFCVRRGWTEANANVSDGHACPLYFATYYRSPSSAEAARELAYAVFSRTFGRGGGPWLHQGAGSHVSERQRKKSAAVLFAPRLRAGSFVPLREFIACAKLTDLRDGRGDARVNENLMLQAGALFEFLLRGPLTAQKPDAIREMARCEMKGAERVAAVEKIFGKTVDEVEKAWIGWGSRPPSRR